MQGSLLFLDVFVLLFLCLVFDHRVLEEFVADLVVVARGGVARDQFAQEAREE